jgi:hypothetical protein
MRPMNIVMLDVDAQHLLQVSASHDHWPVQTLGADRADPAFSVCIRIGRLDGTVASGRRASPASSKVEAPPA